MKHLITTLLLLPAIYGNSQLSDMPVTLSTPFDQDTIEESEPVFVWQSNLSVLQSDPRFSQRLTVVKLEENQTPLEGLAINNPVFIRENLLSTTLPYSATDHELVYNTWYAWQVSFLMNNIVVSQSEAWKFIKVQPEEPKKQYIALRRQADGTIYHLTQPVLYVRIDQSGKIDPKGFVQNEHGIKSEVSVISESGSQNSTGIALCKIDMTELDLPNGVYDFIWTSSEGLRYVLHFKLNN